MLEPVTTARRRATYQDLVEVPDHLVAEILDGELVTSPRPASPHALATSRISVDLGGAFDRPAGGGGVPGGWWLLFEPELHLGEDVIVPDLAAWRRERMPVLPNVAAFTRAGVSLARSAASASFAVIMMPFARARVPPRARDPSPATRP